MNDLVTERLWNRKLAAVNFCARACSGDGRCVANGAADLIKQRFAGQSVGSDRSPRRCFRRSHEVSERYNIDAVVLRVRHWIVRGWVANIATIGGVLIRKKRSGDTHFVEVRVSGKR